MNMTLNWTLRPGERESGFHRLVVFFDRLCKAAQFRDSLLFNLFQPRIKAFPLPLSQHGREFLDQPHTIEGDTSVATPGAALL